jgi:hypothetical protein
MKSILLAAALAITPAQIDGPSLAGTWTAEHGGRTFVRLELSAAGTAIRGRISLGDIELDHTGAITDVSAATGPLTPIDDLKVAGSVVTFSHKDGDDIDHFRMSLRENGTAELTLIASDDDKRDLAESGVTTLKPIKLTRVK